MSAESSQAVSELPDFHLSVAMCPASELTVLAQAAEEAGFAGIAVPDSIFWSEQVSARYPYTATGKRMWTADTPFVDPFVAIAAMAAVTHHIRLLTNVIKLSVRQPVLVAKTVSSLAALAPGRVGLGVGLGWLPEEFLWCGADYKTRGPRADEAIDILGRLLTGELVSHSGPHYEFGAIRLNPVAEQRVPILVGGHSPPALRRAARLGDGWMSAMMKSAEILDTVRRLDELRQTYQREDIPFEIHAVPMDVWDADGYARLKAGGVTTIVTVPWMLLGKGMFVPLADKVSAIGDFGRRYGIASAG